MSLPKKAEIQKIVTVLTEGCNRALSIKLQGYPAPYYCSLTYRYTDYFTTSASYGSTYRTSNTDRADIYCDIRVGTYKYDQTSEGGLRDHEDELESYHHVNVPTDVKELQGMRSSIWKLTEYKFKEALSTYRDKEAQKINKINQFCSLASFAKLPSIKKVKESKYQPIDTQDWTDYAKKLSKWLAQFPLLVSSWIEIDISREMKIFVSSENRIIVQPSQVVSFHGFLKTLTPKGEFLHQELSIHRTMEDELPDEKSLKKELKRKYEQLMACRDGKKLTSFSGPALLMPQPAGLLFHEAIGHRLEGSRLLSISEGHTFRNQEDRKVLTLPITVKDNPNLQSWNNIGCVGAYEFDDEGTQAQDALLIESGILRNFLSTRAQIPAKRYASNGHARNRRYQRPISRMAVTLVESSEGISEKELRAALITEINRQEKPYGVIIYETAGGETDTSTYDFQAFSGQIMFAALLYPDGSEIAIRGVDIVGTPLQALSNIMAVGDKPELDNAFCGAESGTIPVSTISPAVLLSTIELQAKEEELFTPFILPSP
jgi:TldD protein